MNMALKFDVTDGVFFGRTDGIFRRTDALPARGDFRLKNVESLLDRRSGAPALSEARKVRYSVVVKTTEAALRADQSTVDQDNTDQLVIQRVLAGNRDAFK